MSVPFKSFKCRKSKLFWRSLQRNRTNVPSETSCEHYKRAVAIPLLDSLISQMKIRFSDDHCLALKLRYLVPSILRQNQFMISLKIFSSGRKIFHFQHPCKMNFEDGSFCGVLKMMYPTLFFMH